MNGWKSPGENRDHLKLALIVGSGALLLVVAWLVLSRPNEENVSSSGFNSGGAFPTHPTSSAAFTKRSAQTGLSFVRLGEGVAPSAGLAENAPAADAPGQAAAPSAAAASSSATPAAETNKSVMDRIKAMGIPTDAAGLKILATGHHVLSGLIKKIVGYPPAVKFLLNNKVVNDVLFSREPGKTNCQSASALTSYMANNAHTTEAVSLIKALMTNPGSTEATVNSDYATRVMACPSVVELNKNPTALAQVVLANPALLELVADPASVNALTSNPQAAALMSNAQAALGAGGGSPSQ